MTISSVLVRVLCHRLEQLAQNGNVSEERDLVKGLRIAVVEQAADGKALAVTQLDFGVHFPVSIPGTVKPEMVMPLA